jgi:hypothetical protein
MLLDPAVDSKAQRKAPREAAPVILDDRLHPRSAPIPVGGHGFHEELRRLERVVDTFSRDRIDESCRFSDTHSRRSPSMGWSEIGS